MKRLVEKQIESEVLSQYPIQGMVDGWYFRLTETSNGAWLCEGTDLWGRKASCQGSNEALLLQECQAMAKNLAG
jgi:hypothetical protein